MYFANEHFSIHKHGIKFIIWQGSQIREAH